MKRLVIVCAECDERFVAKSIEHESPCPFCGEINPIPDGDTTDSAYNKVWRLFRPESDGVILDRVAIANEQYRERLIQSRLEEKEKSEIDESHSPSATLKRIETQVQKIRRLMELQSRSIDELRKSQQQFTLLLQSQQRFFAENQRQTSDAISLSIRRLRWAFVIFASLILLGVSALSYVMLSMANQLSEFIESLGL